MPDFGKGSIKIIHREHIKVFYNKVKDAEDDGYASYKPEDFSNKDAHLYSFTGLRGDAKTLY